MELFGDLVTFYTSSDVDGVSYETSSDFLTHHIEEAEKDPQIKAIVLEIDSYGGYPVAGEEVTLALRRATKPTVALIREGGLSAAYLAATGADVIFASRSSDVGSIGVTMSYLDNTRKNQNEGLTYVDLSSGKFKDTTSPDRPLSAEERALLMRDVNILHRYFIEMVAEHRNLDVAAVSRIADGSTMLGQMALEHGLIDQIGGTHEVRAHLREILGEEPEICWY